jgi:hypothetical protein
MESLIQYGKEEKLQKLFKAINNRPKGKKWDRLQNELLQWEDVKVCECGNWYSVEDYAVINYQNVKVSKKTLGYCSYECKNHYEPVEQEDGNWFGGDESKQLYYKNKYGEV